MECEGHDVTYISRGTDSETVKTMRDNVLFEIGLCAMALGLNRTILITDSDVRLPDDLMGKNGQLAVKQIPLNTHHSPQKTDSLTYDISAICKTINAYINQEKEHLNQIVIGAAASSACGYATNFIFRTLEHIDDEIIINNGKTQQTIQIPPEQVHLHVVLPNSINEKVLSNIIIKQETLLRGTIATARTRPAEFHFYFEDDNLHIMDYPTNIVTSYDTARIILKMDADDTYDKAAADRFIAKEISLFESTLKNILNEAFVSQTIEDHYPGFSENKKEKIKENVLSVVTNRFTVTRYE